jgi:hypothetical protein
VKSAKKVTGKILGGAILALLVSAFPVGVAAAPGDVLATITVPNISLSCCGIGIAVDCEDPANLYYTNTYETNLHKMDKVGTHISTVALTDVADNSSISFGAISWDETRQKLWGGTDNSGDPVSVYLIDPSTGVSKHIFTVSTAWIGFTDGIAFDGSDNSVWVTDDVTDWVEHWDVSSVDASGVGAAVQLTTIFPKDAAGNALTQISGVAVGKGNILYLGRNGLGKITRVHKDGSFDSEFTTVGGRDEDLECDVVSFAPKEVLWSKDAYNDQVDAIEVEDGTCECPGGELIVELDVKPQSCPNPLNVKSGGRLPVAILGTDDFDVNDVDVSTVTLEGVSPVDHFLRDETEPVANRQDVCDCNEADPDGHLDLTLKFDKQEIVAALGDPADGDVVVLHLTGQTLDGEDFTGQDCVVIVKRGSGPASSEILPFDPMSVTLFQNVPNPFKDGTMIHFALPEMDHATLTVQDVSGRTVATLVDGVLDVGIHSAEWNSDAASGIYFYRLTAGSTTLTKKMILMK